MSQCPETTQDKPGAMKPRNLFDKVVVNGFSAVTLIMSVLLTILIAMATFVRYVIQGDLYGYEEWVKLFAFWLYFSGAAIGAFNRTHVSADLVQSYVPEGVAKRLLVFVKDEAGALFNVLSPLARHGVSMDRIESRPSHQGLWQYAFFIDIEGHVEEPAVKKALVEMQAAAARISVLGSYPIALV